ncbi:MAG: LPS export ABC transporter periplasmic protein LptC [Nitrosomonadales bacterium]|nr:LPS export ABC transporter periplasmic protein LptC [Nitrosomonadales bacterium]
MSLASRARHWLPVLPLLGLLGGTYWLNQQVQPDPGKPDSKKRHDPDAIVESFSAVQLNEQGLPRFTITAKTMRHFPDDDSTTLDTPRITILSPGQPAIHSVAKRGAISGNGDEVFMYDAVEVLRGASAQRDELRVHTEYLRIVPDRNLVSTDRDVSIVEGRNTLRATGLEIDNNAHTIKLLSSVRSEYVPGKK